MLSRYKTRSSPRKHSQTLSITSKPSKPCVLCTISLSFPLTIHKALYTKFASSQNYYYTREINDILLGTRSQRLIKFNDFMTFDEECEYLKRFYQIEDYWLKLKVLTEYYKYHKDIARLFMLPIVKKLNKYHDKRRRVEYQKITKIIKENEKFHENRENFEEFPEKTAKIAEHRDILQEISISFDKNDSNASVIELKRKLKEITANFSSFSKDFSESRSSFTEEKAFSRFLRRENCESLQKPRETFEFPEKKRKILEVSKQMPSKIEVCLKKWPLAKKLALLSKNSKENLACFAEKNVRKLPENEKNSMKTQKNSPFFSQNPKNTSKNLKFDHKILDLIMKTLLKQRKPAEIPLKIAKSPAKPIQNAEKPLKTVTSPSNSCERGVKPLQIAKKNVFSCINSELSQKMRPRIQTFKRNSQPNPLYFEKKQENTEEIGSFSARERLKTSRNAEKTPESSQIQCFTERCEKNSEKNAKIKGKPLKTAKITHKYTKSEPKLLKNQQIRVRNLSPSQVFAYNSSNIVNIFLNSPQNSKKNPIFGKKKCF